MVRVRGGDCAWICFARGPKNKEESKMKLLQHKIAHIRSRHKNDNQQPLMTWRSRHSEECVPTAHQLVIQGPSSLLPTVLPRRNVAATTKRQHSLDAESSQGSLELIRVQDCPELHDCILIITAIANLPPNATVISEFWKFYAGCGILQ